MSKLSPPASASTVTGTPHRASRSRPVEVPPPARCCPRPRLIARPDCASHQDHAPGPRVGHVRVRQQTSLPTSRTVRASGARRLHTRTGLSMTRTAAWRPTHVVTTEAHVRQEGGRRALAFRGTRLAAASTTDGPLRRWEQRSARGQPCSTEPSGTQHNLLPPVVARVGRLPMPVTLVQLPGAERSAPARAGR